METAYNLKLYGLADLKEMWWEDKRKRKGRYGAETRKTFGKANVKSMIHIIMLKTVKCNILHSSLVCMQFGKIKN